MKIDLERLDIGTIIHLISKEINYLLSDSRTCDDATVTSDNRRIEYLTGLKNRLKDQSK